jgi:hypothetical protein
MLVAAVAMTREGRRLYDSLGGFSSAMNQTNEQMDGLTK